MVTSRKPKGGKLSGWVLIAIGILLIAGGSGLVYWGQHTLSRTSITKTEIAEEASNISRQILDFITDRKKYEPQVDFDNWDESTRRLIQYGTETKSLYLTRYGSKVVYLRDALRDYGLTDEWLDMICQDATNAIVIEQGAIALGNLAMKLA